MSDTLNLLKQLIDTQLKMPKGRVWAANSDNSLPKDKKLFIILKIDEVKPYANNLKYEYTADGVNEILTTSVAEDITIALLSRNTEARDRAYEILQALSSTLSQQLQEKNKMHISRLGNIYDASFLEATAFLNRYDIRIRVIRSYQNINPVDYYDKFSIPEIHLEA
ncbi:MAG TPA: hypothetical protein IAD11_01930 [Candidatus Stercorousia faecigallinarum]|nr:hypothetical protein [Candidatus Stercorousia faecigallinarum]